MPDKHPNTDRTHGGPGSTHQNAKKAFDPNSGDDGREPQTPGQSTNPDHSRVSSGGGEQDRHHTHDDRMRS